MTETEEPRFAPGFRMSARDAVALIVGAGLAIALGSRLWQAGAVTAFAVGHFFLFCNVFRIERKPEIHWAALFVSLTTINVLTGFPGWPATFGISLGASAGLIVFEMRKPNYHGIGWKRINPELSAWWKAQINR